MSKDLTIAGKRDIIMSRFLTTKQRGDYMSVQEARENKKMTQEQLATEMGVSRTAVAMWESKRVLPRAARLIKLAEILGVTVDELLTERK